jgi:Tfp pilus assembly protein PilE
MPDDNPVDTSSPEVDTPSDPNVPSDSPLAAGLKEDVTSEQQQDEFNKLQQDLVKRIHDEHERYRAQMQPLVDHFQQSMTSQADMQPPQQSQIQMPQAAKNNAAQSVMSLLAIAAIAYTVFGRKSGNSFGQAALMNGLGSMFQGYAQGRHQKAEDDKAKWHELWQMKNQENKDRLQQYRETLANKRLDLSQQMDLIKMQAAQHHDFELELAAEQKNLNAVVKNLEAKRKAHQRVISGLVGANAKDYKSGPSAEWRQEVLEKSKGEIDPARSDDEREKAYELYPYSQFLKDRKETAKQIEEEKKKGSDKDPLDLGL